MTRLWTKNYILLIIASGFSRCSFDILLPTLPVFLTLHGIGSGEVGIVMGIFTFSAIVVRFFAAEGSHRFGMKRLLYTGLVICAAISAAYNLGTTFTSAASLRIIHGFGFGLATTLAASIAAGVIPDTRRGEGFGYLGFGALITSAIAPFLGLWLLNDLGSTALFSFTALTQLGCIFCMANVSVKKLPITKHPLKSVFDGMIDKSLLFPCLLAMLMGICLSSVICFVALFGQEIHIANIGWFFLASTLGAFTVRLFAGRIFDTYGRSWVIIPAALLIMSSLILVALTTTFHYLIAAAVLFGLGYGALFPALQAWIINRVSPERHTQANAMYFNALDTGVGGGSILLGFIISMSNFTVMYLISAAMMAILLAIYTASLLKKRSRPD